MLRESTTRFFKTFFFFFMGSSNTPRQFFLSCGTPEESWKLWKQTKGGAVCGSYCNRVDYGVNRSEHR